MTVLGAVLMSLAAVGVLLRRRVLVAVALGVAAGVPSSAGIVLVQPVPIFACVGAVAGVALFLRPVSDGRPRALSLLSAFLAWSLVWTALAPWVFAGVPVLTPRGGVERQLSALTPLDYTTTNFAQAVILLAAVCATAFLLRSGTAQLALAVAAWVGITTSLVRVGLRQIGLDVLAPVLDTLQTYYANTDSRWRGVFNEPSELAAFATGATVYAVVRAARSERPGERLAHGALASGGATLLLGSASGTALVAAAIVLGIASVLLLARFATSGGRGAPWIIAAVIVAAIAGLLFGDVLVAPAVDLLQAKIGSKSHTARSGADIVGLDVLWSTRGFGAGLGGNRSSSFIVTLLSTVGVVGTALFAWVLASAVRSGSRVPTALPAVAALLAIVIAKAVAVPDLGTPLLWLLLSASTTTALVRSRSVGSIPCDGVEWAGPGSGTSPSRTSRATPSTSPASSPTHPRPSRPSRP